jgi:hypothetical protein
LEEPARLIASPPALLPDTRSGVAPHLGPRAVPEAEGQRDDRRPLEQRAVGAAAAAHPHDADTSADRAGADAADDAAALREALLRTKLELVRPSPRTNRTRLVPPPLPCCPPRPLEYDAVLDMLVHRV